MPKQAPQSAIELRPTLMYTDRHFLLRDWNGVRMPLIEECTLDGDTLFHPLPEGGTGIYWLTMFDRYTAQVVYYDRMFRLLRDVYYAQEYGEEDMLTPAEWSTLDMLLCDRFENAPLMQWGWYRNNIPKPVLERAKNARIHVPIDPNWEDELPF